MLVLVMMIMLVLLMLLLALLRLPLLLQEGFRQLLQQLLLRRALISCSTAKLSTAFTTFEEGELELPILATFQPIVSMVSSRKARRRSLLEEAAMVLCHEWLQSATRPC